MNWIETFNLVISLLAVVVSAFSIYLAHQNKQDQQELEREMQENEFKFSRKKVWYEKQNEVLDESLSKLMENRSNLRELHLLSRKNDLTSLERDNLITSLETTRINNNYIAAYKHYFPESLDSNIDSIVNSTGYVLANLGPVSEDTNNNANDEEINKHMKNIYSNIKAMTNEIRSMFLN